MKSGPDCPRSEGAPWSGPSRGQWGQSVRARPAVSLEGVRYR